MSMECTTSTTGLVEDGNVLLMSLPQQVTTLAEIASFVSRHIITLMSSCAVVVLCFDDPSATPPTKTQTQQKRDARVRFQDAPDGHVYPTSDAFDLECLRSLATLKPMIQNRQTRYRTFDAIIADVIVDIREHLQIAREAASTSGYKYQESVVVFDGIDPRGAERPAEADRFPAVLTSNSVYGDLIVKSRIGSISIGEADLKIQNVAEVLSQSDQTGLRIIILYTIDTDALPISMLSKTSYARDADADQQNGSAGPTLAHIVLCMKERGAYAARQLKQPTAPNSPYMTTATGLTQSPRSPPGVLIIDSKHAVRTLLDGCHTELTSEESRACMLFIACMWAYTGCDFVPSTLGHTDTVTNACIEMVNVAAPRISAMMLDFERQWTDVEINTSAIDDTQLITELSSVALSSASMLGVRVKAAASLRSIDIHRMRQSIWTALYWSAPCAGFHRSV